MYIYILVSSYFCTHIFHLLDFDTDDMILFNTKYFFFLLLGTFNSIQFNSIKFNHSQSPNIIVKINIKFVVLLE